MPTFQFPLFTLTCLLLSLGHAQAVDQPNIIYILADDLGYSDLGCYGGEIIQTPHIDRMRAEGIKFTDHYAGSCMCAPTRCSLMTGLHTGHARVRGNSGHLKKGRIALEPEDVTIGEVLKEAGYATGVIGKWGLGEPETTGIPTKQGFDFWFGYLNQSNAHHYYPPYLWRNEEKVEYPDNPTKRTHYSHDLFTEEALGFIDAQKDGPFFLYLAYTIPHVDLDVPEDSKKPYVGVIEETEPYGTPGGQHYRYEEQPHATFAGMVSRMDRDVGRILTQLKELGLDENTLVIFTSDNGPTGAGGADPDFFNGNGPLRGIKFEVYDGGIRVPFIARWPGKITPGTESNHPSAHWDMMPTFAELAKAEVPDGIDGISMLSSMLLRRDGQKEHEYLYWEAYNGGGQQALRQGDWKAVRRNVLKKDKTSFELFNLKDDIAETQDLAKDYPEVADRLRLLMDKAHVPNEYFAFE